MARPGNKYDLLCSSGVGETLLRYLCAQLMLLEQAG